MLFKRLASSITHHGIPYPGRAHYVILNLSAHLQLGIINVYGFNHTSPQAMLWNHLAQVALLEAYWVLAEDFNNIEHTRDKQGVSDTFNLGDFCHKIKKTFTWTNAHDDEIMI